VVSRSAASSTVSERLVGVVDRVTFQCPRTGWTVLKVAPFGEPHNRVTVTLHHVAVFAGATMEFLGNWTNHPRHGRQFAGTEAFERKPASAAALERYLGSGMIRGVGPAIARKIVRQFGDDTLRVFEDDIARLVEVRGIAERKLEAIRSSWTEHRAIRDVMLFLQQHGVSTLFAVKIYKAYGDAAIARVSRDPYCLARDIYGIGFFSADRVAQALGFGADDPRRLDAGIRHVLSASREAGHCYLRREQVLAQAGTLLSPEEPERLQGIIGEILDRLVGTGEVLLRELFRAADLGRDTPRPAGATEACAPEAAPSSFAAYYAPSLYRAEASVAQMVARRIGRREDVDPSRVDRWLDAHQRQAEIALSPEQRAAVKGIVRERFAVLTGGPGCGKTTTLRTLARLLEAMRRRVVLAAPTGRAAQRMSEVVGVEAKTAHRLLEWDPVRGTFRHDAEHPLVVDVLVVDESSMLDVVLAAALLAAVPAGAQVLLIGDPHQLPSVGPGAVLADLLAAPRVPRFRLTQVFRQAAASSIISSAHAIDRGESPDPPSPLADPGVWARGVDCLFVDAEEATAAELAFLRRAKRIVAATIETGRATTVVSDGRVLGALHAAADAQPGAAPGERGALGVNFVAAGPEAQAAVAVASDGAEPTDAVSGVDLELVVPRRFLHVDLEALARSRRGVEEIRAVLRRLHPHSTLHHGLSLTDAIVRLVAKTVPQRLGADAEIQILTPMNRGTVGADALNGALQAALNPAGEDRTELRLGQRILRLGDRVIQRRNDYDLGVFNGDIGRIVAVDPLASTVDVAYATGVAREVRYPRESLADLGLAYAITVHKSQGSEFPVVIIPICAQHHAMLFRDLVYTALTRARRLAIFVGSRHALRRAIANVDPRLRQTALAELLERRDEGVE
jgi:exodeoxyribonuclease V alpha subunit